MVQKQLLSCQNKKNLYHTVKMWHIILLCYNIYFHIITKYKHIITKNLSCFNSLLI